MIGDETNGTSFIHELTDAYCPTMILFRETHLYRRVGFALVKNLRLLRRLANGAVITDETEGPVAGGNPPRRPG